MISDETLNSFKKFLTFTDICGILPYTLTSDYVIQINFRPRWIVITSYAVISITLYVVFLFKQLFVPKLKMEMEDIILIGSALSMTVCVNGTHLFVLMNCKAFPAMVSTFFKFNETLCKKRTKSIYILGIYLDILRDLIGVNLL